MRVELSPDAMAEIMVHELCYWRDNLETDTKFKEDNKRNKAIIKACETLLEFYTA